jgi:superfamily II DNA or RNA helicase
MDCALTADADPHVRLRAARDRIAAALLGDIGERPTRLGRIELRPHQETAVARLVEIIARHRGAVLADAVGLGKTFVALAIAKRHARPLIICPASLRPMWKRATGTSGMDVPILSSESLSRGARPAVGPDFVIVDEAHHFRTPRTRRYEALASIARRARLLLLSATPLQNSRRDVTTLLALFAGSGVENWTDAAIARAIVRRDEETAFEVLPSIAGHALTPGTDDDCLDRILELPPAVPAADEGTAHALTILTLVHLWSSSRAALIASVKKRRARAIALRDAVQAGHLPTAAELAMWQFADDSLQMAFPFCATGSAPDGPGLARQLDAFIATTERLVDSCRITADPDLTRVEMLRTLRVRHEGLRCVAFSQYAQTVVALGRLMRADHGVAVMTASGGRTAGGPVTRDEVLAQLAADAPPPHPANRIDLLLTTDLLSEGVDLRGAAVIVHLDLPWNPARLEQRVGRARRIGSAHEMIHVYTFMPPAPAERMLELERRLTAKLRTADALVGSVRSLLLGPEHRGPSPVSAAEALRARLKDWIEPAARDHTNHTALAAVTAPRRGWIALVRLDGLPRLICSHHTASDDPAECLAMIGTMGDAIPADRELQRASLAEVERWLAPRSATAELRNGSGPKRAVLDRLSQTVARAPRHRRSALLASAQRARAGLATVAGAGAERVLQDLARSTADDDGWMRSLEEFAMLNGQDPRRPDGDGRIEALILLG